MGILFFDYHENYYFFFLEITNISVLLENKEKRMFLFNT